MLAQELMNVLRNGGIATAGSNTTLTDTSKSWIVNAYAGMNIKVLINGVEYNSTIVSNTATQLTFNALPGGATVVAGDPYFFPLDLAIAAVAYFISFYGVTTGNGNAGGTTLVCAGLAGRPNQDGLQVKMLSGGAVGQVRTIQVHDITTGVITVGAPFTNLAGVAQQIVTGTVFVVISILSGGGGPGPAPTEGLSYYGIVDAVPGGNQFTIGGLVGLGAGKFAGTNPYMAFVLRDAGGASGAPQGEQQAITVYNSATGTFTTNAFTFAVAVGDEILILHPDVAGVLGNLSVPGVDAVTNILERDVIGNKTDTPVVTPDLVSSLTRYAKGNLNATGLFYRGTVTNWVNATQFAALGLAGFGDQAFANGHYFVFAFRDSAGAAALPQGDFRLLQTYVSATGMFTHEAFANNLANGDTVIIIHQSLLFPNAVPGWRTFTTSSATDPVDNARTEGNDFFNNYTIMPLAGACAFQRRPVAVFVAGGTYQLAEPFTTAPGTVEYLLFADQYPSKINDALQVLNNELVLKQATNLTTTVKNNSVTLFALDALAKPVMSIQFGFYLVADAAATFTISVWRTRSGDLVTFIQDLVRTWTIVTPAAAGQYSYDAGDLPQGLQMEIRVAQNNAGNATNVIDSFLEYLQGL